MSAVIGGNIREGGWEGGRGRHAQRVTDSTGGHVVRVTHTEGLLCSKGGTGQLWDTNRDTMWGCDVVVSP